MTSAIMNPLHDEDMHAIFGANVLNGTDRNCKFWTNKFREMSMPAGGHEAVGDGLPGAVERRCRRPPPGPRGTRAGAADRRCMTELRKPTPSSSSRRPASAGASRSARRCCRRRARSASISIRCAAGGPSAGAARSLSAKANSPSTASPRASTISRNSPRSRSATTTSAGLRAGRRLSCQTQASGRCRHRRAAGKPGAQAGGAQARRGARHRDGSGHPALLHRGRGAGHAQALLRSRARLPGA